MGLEPALPVAVAQRRRAGGEQELARHEEVVRHRVRGQVGQIAQAEAAQGGWWSARTGTLLGAMMGSLVGVVGALIGVLGGRGRARSLVIGLLVGMITVGACLALVGVAAALSSQPRHVWYPLLVIGGASGLIGLVILPAMRRRFAADELRRIEAMDAGARS